MKFHYLLIVAPGLVSLSGSAFGQSSGDSSTPAKSAPPIVLSGTMGLTFVDSVSDTQTYNFLGSADRDNKGVDHMHLDGAYFFSRQTTAPSTNYNVTSNFAFANARYDRDISGRLAIYGALGYRVDNSNNLKLRQLYNAGLAYDVHDGKVWNWSLSAGGAYLIENYTNGLSSSYTPSAAFGSQYNRNFGDKLTVSHTLTFIPAFSNFSNYVATSVLSVGYQLAKPVKLSVNNVVDYQSDPPAGTLKKNQTWFIGLTFGGNL